MKPRTVKSYLKLCLEIAYTNRDELKGCDKLTKEEYLSLGAMRAGIQNELGDIGELLEKHKLKYNSNN
jgi:hypothetical protein